MAINLGKNFGGEIKCAIGTVPAASSAGSVNGSAIDRMGFSSCVLEVQTGAETGTPSARSATVKLQDSADGSTGWADITGASVAVSAVNTRARLTVSLGAVKRYIRAVNTTAFTGGTTPTLASAAVVILGGADTTPAQADG